MDNDNTFDDDLEGSGRSVFGDDPSTGSGSSVFGDESGETPLEVLPIDEPSNSVFADTEQASIFADGTAHDSDEIRTASLDDWTTPTSDDAPTGEAISLDVDPGEEDLDAWSDLNSSAPAWGDQNELEDEPAAWDPGPAPNEPAVVQIGGDQSERFFTYDDQGHGGGELSGEDFAEQIGTSSDMQSRIITGVALLAIALVAINLGPLVALGLIVIVVALSAAEFFNALRVAGYRPATLLGLTAAISMPLAVYVRGTQAVAMVLALSVVFALLWYLAGVSTEMPVMNIGVTLLGIVYVGVLGSFGAALLEVASRGGLNGDDGTGLLLAAVIVTVGYDVGAFFAGRSFGRTPLSSVSPNKTWEGLVGGAVASLLVAVVFFRVVPFIEPFDSHSGTFDALLLGVIGAIVAPLGDLGESLIKRDLGIKDMGSVLPGHGGFLDRFDALLFMLPAVYFFAEAVFYTS